jgi:MarR-like DNA-binding transcriptional regulator SgrR of sgrS sRNA
VRFHDGVELTAGEVKRAFERSLRSPRLRSQLEPVDGITVNGEHELRITTHRIEPLLIDRLAQVLIARPGGAADRFFVGTGPYRPVAWKKGERLQLEAFGNYWRGRPAIDRAVFVAAVTPGEERAHLSRGEVDIQRLATDFVLPASHTFVTRASLGCVYLWFGSQHARRPRQPASWLIRRCLPDRLTARQPRRAEEVGVANEFPQQRRFPRITAEHTVLVTKAGAETHEELARTRDVGLGGCMFLSDEPLGPGSVIEVLISLGRRVVPTTARVVYEHASERRFEIGVEFLRLDPDDHQFLQSFFGADLGDA